MLVSVLCSRGTGGDVAGGNDESCGPVPQGSAVQTQCAFQSKFAEDRAKQVADFACPTCRGWPNWPLQAWQGPQQARVLVGPAQCLTFFVAQRCLDSRPHDPGHHQGI